MQLIKGFLDGLRPVRKVTVSEWADTNRYLTTESAAEPGLWRTARTPYLKEIMDALSPTSLTKEVVIVKGVQLGFTESALNIVGCYIDLSPTPIMYVMPTVEMSRAISEGRIDPMVEHSEVLKLKVRPARERDSGNTKLVKRFPGGILVLSGANSAASLRSRPVRVLILDEIDAYPLNIDNEGSPVSLAEKRTSTFGSRKKIFKLSTPTIEGASIIQREFDGTDQRKYFVPCPHCNEMQELKFENLIWDKGLYETVKYSCSFCGSMIEERSKNSMLINGKWRSMVPEKRCDEKIGFHLNSLYSPLGWKSWADIAEEWEKAQGDSNLLRVFINTILGETWKEKGDAPAWEFLFDRREKYALNKPKKEVVFITGGADVQKDRIEVEIVGWCRKKISYSIDYRVIMGDTSSKAVWDKLDEIVNESWTREDGVQLPMKLMAVDTGYNTTEVYEFCRRFDASKVIPVKGQDKQPVIISAPKYVDVNTKTGKKGKLRLFNVGVSMLKSELYGWLRLRIDEGVEPAGYCHFPEYGEDYFKGITAEELKFKITHGYRQYFWEKRFARNEPLDARNYARAAASIVGMDRFNDGHWDRMDGSNSPVKRPDSSKKKKKESSFWGK
ncbi:MAG: phage terminase large subunit family protein [Bacteroidetes bacterium]|nr:MAG: phage terminase large subunit family protein [Bacteroidota bacterium]